jgi:hypothetical protein
MIKDDIHKITSYDQLQHAKGRLKGEIYFQEEALKDTQVFKIGSSLLQGKVKNPLINSDSPFNLNGIVNGPIGSLLSTFLMANKKTRKYFVSFTIAKEIVPFALQKINDIFLSNNKEEKF